MTPEDCRQKYAKLLSIWKEGERPTLAELCDAPYADAHIQDEHRRRHARGVTIYDRCLLTGSGIRLD